MTINQFSYIGLHAIRSKGLQARRFFFFFFLPRTQPDPFSPFPPPANLLAELSTLCSRRVRPRRLRREIDFFFSSAKVQQGISPWPSSMLGSLCTRVVTKEVVTFGRRCNVYNGMIRGVGYRWDFFEPRVRSFIYCHTFGWMRKNNFVFVLF